MIDYVMYEVISIMMLGVGFWWIERWFGKVLVVVGTLVSSLVAASVIVLSSVS